MSAKQRLGLCGKSAHAQSQRLGKRRRAKAVAGAQEQGVGSLRIVYGKGYGSPGGRGVLREVIPRWLDDRGRELIRRYERRPDASGADGGLIVWVRPLEPDEQEGD